MVHAKNYETKSAFVQKTVASFFRTRCISKQPLPLLFTPNLTTVTQYHRVARTRSYTFHVTIYETSFNLHSRRSQL